VADSTITFVVLAAAVVLFVWNRFPVAVVAVGVSLALWATGVLELEQALAGFGDPTVVYIAALFVVSEGLEATGVTTWVGQQLVARAGTARSRVVVLVMTISALVTALISVNGAVAALVPVVVVVAIRVRQPSSQLLMPLAFGAHAGALLALTGSPVNVLVADAAGDAGVGRFGYFEFALAGVPLLVGTIVLTLLLGERVLPHRSAKAMPPDFSALASTLALDYELDPDDPLFTRHVGAAELLVPPRSGMIGQTVFPGMVTESGDLVILAVQRGGEPVAPGEVVLEAGDAVLVRGTWEALAEHLPADDDVRMVEEPDRVRRQIVPLGLRAAEAVAVVAAMVLLLATGAAPPAVAALVAAGALVVLKVVTIDQAYRAVSWTTVVLVAGMLPLSVAMQQTGAAADLAELLTDAVGDTSSYALLGGLFVLTAALGQLISNTATALIVIPIAVSSAVDLGVSPRPVLMAVNVAAAGALLTPVATPANLMVMEPGGYRFGDYWRYGLPLLGWFFVVSVGVVPLIWRF
jgi:di/tricarboxylate transporter